MIHFRNERNETKKKESSVAQVEIECCRSVQLRNRVVWSSFKWQRWRRTKVNWRTYFRALVKYLRCENMPVETKTMLSHAIISQAQWRSLVLGVDYTSLAFWMCSFDVRFAVECVFYVIFSVKNSKMTSKSHSTGKRTSKLHIQNASIIDP
jgi:hypothetical protein